MPIFNAHAANNCTGATYYDADSDTCIACPTGYDYNTTAGKTSVNQCQISCSAGTWVSDEYTQLEYIGTNHNAYIISDLKVNDFDRVTARGTLYDTNTEVSGNVLPTLFGASAATSGASDNGKVFRFNNSSQMMTAVYGSTAADSWVNSSTGNTFPLNTPTDIDVKLANGEQYIKINGNTIASDTLSATLNNPNNVTIFAMNYGGQIRYIPHFDCERITFYLGNDIVRDLIPARRNSDNEIGLYDTVTGQFFTNSGTGSFTAGSDVGGCFDVGLGYYAGASTTNYGSIGTRTACPAGTYNDTTNATSAAACLPCSGATYNDETGMGACKSCPTGYDYNTTSGKTDATQCQIQCPGGTYVSGYTQLEYIESNGTQIINTGYVLQETDSVEVDYELRDLSTGGDKMIVAQATDSNVGMWVETYGSTNTWYVRYGSTASVNTAFQNSQTSGTFTIKKGSFTVNGTNILQPTFTSMSSNPLTIFARLNGSTVQYGAHVRISGVRVKNGSNETIMNLIPAKNSSDVLGMFDTVSGTFFANAGTGSFIAGSDVGGCFDVGIGYYAPASTTNYGSVGTKTACPSGTTTSGANSTSASDCRTCNNDEISVYTNNGATLTCIPLKFTVTTTDLDISKNTEFKFNLSATGTFYVDCGADGTLSGTGVSGNTITRTNTTNALYTCTYTTGDVKTIKFGGIATAYSTGSTTAAINFYTNATPTLVGGISGSLGALCPTLGSTNGLQPRFYSTFRGCTKITSIPSELFTGLSGTPASNMFQQTFYGCSGLTGSIPSGLFGNVSGSPRNASGLFASTFYNCSGLTGSIPENLFSKISGAPGNGTFNSTFYGCSKLSGSIPEDLFAGISGATNANTFTMTFYNCKGLTGSIPAGLFRNISGAPQTTMFYATFAGCSGLTGSIPEDLFAGISGAPATGVFRETFNGCSGLTGSIPEDLFAGVSGAPADSMFYQTFKGCSGLTGSIPTGLFGSLSGAPASRMFKDTFNGCSGLTGSIPSGLFGSLSGAPATEMFYYTFNGCSGLTGSIPSGLFGSLSGAPATEMFYSTFNGCSGLTGSIPSGLFGNLSGEVKNNMFRQTFYNCRGLTGSIPSGLFGNLSGTVVVGAQNAFESTFYNCSGLTGSIPSGLFGNISGAPSAGLFKTTFYNCRGLTGSIPSGLFGSLSGRTGTDAYYRTFYGCSGLSGYVPKDIFENITISNYTVGIFTNTNLYTTCPCGTKPAATGWGATKLDSRAICEVGTKTNEHWDNGTCTTDCTLGVTRFKSSTGLDYPLLSDPTGVHNIYFGYNNGVCHVPLVSGAANNAINVSFNGETYHASQPDEIMPTGFTGQPAAE